MEDMALRKSPVRTLACLTANRANAQKSTGPATPAAKARVALNALKHGGRTDPAGAGKSFCGRATGRGRLCTAGSAGNYRHLWEGQAVRGTAGRSDSSRGVVPGARLG